MSESSRYDKSDVFPCTFTQVAATLYFEENWSDLKTAVKAVKNGEMSTVEDWYVKYRMPNELKK